MRCLLSGFLLLSLLAPPAWAGTDLRDVRPVGFAGSDTAALGAAGDVNGDGVEDVVVGLQDDVRTRDPASLAEIAVVGFGPGPPDPARPGFTGLVVSHLNEPQLFDGQFGQSVGGTAVGVGDWDGDGLGDVAFGAVGAGPHRRANAGSVYVVLGRREPGAVDLRTDPRVVRIDGPARGSRIGGTLAPAGDVDGDGRPDVVIALPGERAVVVRGGAPAGTSIDLARPPAGGTIELRGLDAGTPRGPAQRGAAPEAAAFAAAGDVDGDGRGELLVGLPAAEPLRGRGRVLVLRGAAAGAVVQAERSLIARIVGPEGVSGFGGSLATQPDVDGDGRVEWVVGAATPDGVFGIGGELPSGATVVFSSARGEVRPGRPGQPVVIVDARGRGPDAGRTVAGIPDATGDGVPDLLVGLPDASPRCRERAGAIALVPGRRTPGTVRIGRSGPRIDGPYPGAEVGDNVAFGGGQLLMGTRPFTNAASLELWRVPSPSGASPALPRAEDCLKVTFPRRTRAQLARGATLRVAVRSDAGDGRAHRLRVGVGVFAGRTLVEGKKRALRLPRAGTRRLTLRLPPRAVRLLARGTTASVFVTAEQHIGSGIRSTRGATGGDGYVLKATRR